MVRVGIVSTSWWADSMYLPALQDHPHGAIVAVCGRDPERTRAFAQKWNIPHYYTDWREMIASGQVDAVIVAAHNEAHYSITMAALDAGLHVLCEKPLALNYAQAKEMAERAAQVGVKTMVAFTHHWLPSVRYTKQLVDEGYIGRPYLLNMRYYSGSGFRTTYRWRSDARVPGSGVLADLGSHLLHLARLFYGEVTGLNGTLSAFTQRDHPTADEHASITLRFANGAVGVLVTTMVAWVGSGRGQALYIELHGQEGALQHTMDWDKIQEVRGLKAGETETSLLPIPDEIWGPGVRRDTAANTYTDTFRRNDFMARGFVTAIAEDRPCYPDFNEGARVQQLQDAVRHSAENGSCWVEV